MLSLWESINHVVDFVWCVNGRKFTYQRKTFDVLQMNAFFTSTIHYRAVYIHANWIYQFQYIIYGVLCHSIYSIRSVCLTFSDWMLDILLYLLNIYCLVVNSYQAALYSWNGLQCYDNILMNMLAFYCFFFTVITCHLMSLISKRIFFAIDFPWNFVSKGILINHETSPSMPADVQFFFIFLHTRCYSEQNKCIFRSILTIGKASIIIIIEKRLRNYSNGDMEDKKQ